MSGIWNDFNSAQSNSNVIPKGTLAKVRLTLRPGGFDDPSPGWTGPTVIGGLAGGGSLTMALTLMAMRARTAEAASAAWILGVASAVRCRRGWGSGSPALVMTTAT